MNNEQANAADSARPEYAQAMQAEAAYWADIQQRRLEENELTPELDLRRCEALGRRRLRDPYGGPGYVFDPALRRYCLPMRKLYALLDEVAARGGRGLELGCGAGWLSLELARAGVEMDAYDISAGALEIAARLAREDPWQASRAVLRYHVADMNVLELPPAQYDTIVVWCSMHHCARPRHVLAQINRALKPTGRAYLVDNTGGCRLGRILGTLLYTLTPTTEPLGGKWRRLGARVSAKLLRRPPPAPGKPAHASPMEGICRFDALLALAREELRVERVTTVHAFCQDVVRYTVLPTPLRQPLLFLLGLADYALTRAGLLRGHHGIIRASKRPHPQAVPESAQPESV